MKAFLSDRKRAAAYLMMIVVFIIVGIFAPREKLGYSEYKELAETVDFEAGETMPAETVVSFGAWTLLVPVVMFVFVHPFLRFLCGLGWILSSRLQRSRFPRYSITIMPECFFCILA